MEILPVYDVVIIGAGLAGLSLARQLLLTSDKTVLLVDKRSDVPPPRQKVGEATVQVSGYYLSKVLDLEEHLLREHFMKYNLRFYWKTAGRRNSCYEDYSQCYIRAFSNIASYQLDRNKLEVELLRRNRQTPNFDFAAPVADLNVSLSQEGLHEVTLRNNGAVVSAKAEWVVDTSGRGKFLVRRVGLGRPNSIRHGASFVWVDGLVNVEKLTDLSPREIRLRRDRALTGHLPVWLATNHFMGEGFWFWIIPLQGKTSLGLVYDNRKFCGDLVCTPQKLIKWVCHEFPLFAHDLPSREILNHGSFRDFSYDCGQAISRSKWALSGEAGRFSDPLYSPGGDLIALHNTFITDAILTPHPDDLASKILLYDQLMRSLYEAYVPSYAVSYDVLGDQEAFALKYTWELSVYFAFYVFPFINDLFTDPKFVRLFLCKFSRLGQVKRNLQSFISAYYQWKKSEAEPCQEPLFHDFTDIGSLRGAESAFYHVGVSVGEAAQILERQYDSLRELARYIGAYVSSVVLSDRDILTNRSFVESVDLEELRFDPDEMRERCDKCTKSCGAYRWSFNPFVLERFRSQVSASLQPMASAEVGK